LGSEAGPRHCAQKKNQKVEPYNDGRGEGECTFKENPTISKRTKGLGRGKNYFDVFVEIQQDNELIPRWKKKEDAVCLGSGGVSRLKWNIFPQDKEKPPKTIPFRRSQRLYGHLGSIRGGAATSQKGEEGAQGWEGRSSLILHSSDGKTPMPDPKILG